jgi:hypothetical protein
MPVVKVASKARKRTALATSSDVPNGFGRGSSRQSPAGIFPLARILANSRGTPRRSGGAWPWRHKRAQTGSVFIA